jgi:hypothetical protein
MMTAYQSKPVVLCNNKVVFNQSVLVDGHFDNFYKYNTTGYLHKNVLMFVIQLSRYTLELQLSFNNLLTELFKCYPCMFTQICNFLYSSELCFCIYPKLIWKGIMKVFLST